MIGSIVETDSIYGDNWDFYQNFEQLPNSGLRLPSYLSWLENQWYLYGDNDFEQVRLALSHDWDLDEELRITEDSEGHVVDVVHF